MGSKPFKIELFGLLLSHKLNLLHKQIIICWIRTDSKKSTNKHSLIFFRWIFWTVTFTVSTWNKRLSWRFLTVNTVFRCEITLNDIKLNLHTQSACKHVFCGTGELWLRVSNKVCFNTLVFSALSRPVIALVSLSTSSWQGASVLGLAHMLTHN